VTVRAGGLWSLETEARPDWIVAQCGEKAVGAAVIAPDEAARLELPELVKLDLEQGSEETVTAWVDPIELIGFPSDLVWSLFVQADSVVKLHVAELALPPRGRRATVFVQRGRYRLSGGTVSLRPSIGAHPMQLVSVTDVTSGVRIVSREGVAILDVQGPSRYGLDFGAYG
jgi:hypothetical protein